jgi:hypothetical protein
MSLSPSNLTDAKLARITEAAFKRLTARLIFTDAA